MRGLRNGLLAAALAMVGFAASAGEALKVWHHGGRVQAERETIEGILREWSRLNPDYPAEYVLLPEGAYNEQVQAAALANRLPDLLDFDASNYANYAWAGYLEPLNRYYPPEFFERFLPSILEQGLYAPDGQYYSLGWFDSGTGMWINRPALEKAGIRIPKGVDDPWSREEFEDALARLKAAGFDYPLDLKLNYGKGESFCYGFGPIIQSFGADIIDRETWIAAGTLDSDAAVEAMTMVQNWVRNGYVVPASLGDDAFYGSRKAAICYTGMWMWTPHRENLGDALGLVTMPNFKERQVSATGSWCWGVTTASRHKEKVAELLAFMMRDEYVLLTANVSGAIPSTMAAAAQSELYKKDGPMHVLIKQLEDGLGVPRPNHPGYPAITAAVAQAVADIVDGRDVREALSEAAAAIDMDIEDNQGYPPFGDR
ncbi:MAG: sugar ABC transporter substrate-binding protein [Planctomycetota bacterium]|jgi:multiple sugar transport system substrate-binding protein|nr:sugar ABC transporter substrate-binding protein [Planctomycetota bacterium]